MCSSVWRFVPRDRLAAKGPLRLTSSSRECYNVLRARLKDYRLIACLFDGTIIDEGKRWDEFAKWHEELQTNGIIVP